MEHRQLGRSGLRVSALAMGTSVFGSQVAEANACAILDKAVDGGITFIDTADMYPAPAEQPGLSEEIVGRWLAQRPRDSVVLASKVWGETGPGLNDRGLSRAHILTAIDASLRRLGTDYLDLYHLHFPDTSVRIEETLQALDDVVRWGKVRYIAASNFAGWQLVRALNVAEAHGLTRFICNQARYNVLYREPDDEIFPLCRATGLGITIYNPLAGGMLTGKYANAKDRQEGSRFSMGSVGAAYRDRYWDEIQFDQVRRLQAHFAERGIPLTQAVLAWALAREGMSSVMIGASRPAQLDDLLAATELQLEEADLALCDDVWYHLPRKKKAALVINWKNEGEEE